MRLLLLITGYLLLLGHTECIRQPCANADPVAWCVCQSPVMRLRSANTVQWIDVLFGVETPGPKAHCARWGRDPPRRGGVGEMSPIVPYTTVPTRSPGGATFDAATAKLP